MIDCDDSQNLSVLISQSLPLRSTLYRLVPLNAMTGDRESLGSYFCRLADAHCTTPQRLSAFVMPMQDENFNARYWNNVWREHRFSGSSSIANKWSEVLSKLTTVERLDRLTMLPVSKTINSAGLMQGRKWCPLCIAEHNVNGMPYGKLIWELGVVTVCTKHRVTLTDRCSCQGVDREIRERRKVMFHLCADCGRNLGESSVQPRHATADELFAAQLVHDFFGSVYFNDSGRASMFQEFLAALIDRDFGGKAAWLAKAVGIPKSVIHGWQLSGYTPSLQRFVELATKLSCSIENLFVGILPATASFVSAEVNSRTKKRNKLDLVKVEARLRDALVQHVPVSVHQLARDFEVHPKSLYFAFGELTQQIAKRRLEFMRNRRQVTLNRLEDLLRQEARQLLQENLNPTQRRMIERLGTAGRLFTREQKAICRRVLLEEKERGTVR